MLILGNIVFLMLTSLLLVAQGATNIIASSEFISQNQLDEMEIYYAKDKDDVRSEIKRQLRKESGMKTFSLMQFEKENLLFSFSRDNNFFHLVTFNPEIYEFKDIDWNFLYKIYTFDSNFDLAFISTFKEKFLLSWEKVSLNGQDYISMNMPLHPFNYNYSNGNDLIYDLNTVIDLYQFHEHHNSPSKILIDGGCKNFYVRLLSSQCER